MDKKWRSAALSLGLLLIVLGAGIWYIASHSADFEFVYALDGSVVIPLVAAATIYLFTQCALFRLSMLPFGIALRPSEWLGLMLVTLFTNYFVPVAGLGVRALYLSRRYKLSLGDFAVATGGVLLIELLVYSLCGLAALLTVFSDSDGSSLLLVGLGGAAAATMLGMTLSPTWLPFRGGLFEKGRALLLGWQRMRAHSDVLWPLFAWTLIQYLTFAIMFYLAFRAVGEGSRLALPLAVAAVTDFGFLLRLAPGSAGSFEAAILLSSSAFGVGTAQALVTAFLVRGAITLPLLLLGPYFAFTLARQENKG